MLQVFYLDRVETSLLVVQGTEDFGVAPFLGDQILTTLRRFGKSHICKYEREEHDPSDWGYANQLASCTRMIEWFDSQLKRTWEVMDRSARGAATLRAQRSNHFPVRTFDRV